MAQPKLHGLEAVDWSALEHAYGSAADIAELLELLASGTPEGVEEALGELYGNIVHQGTMYSATAPTVPFLIQVAADARNIDRHKVLYLLNAIADGWLDAQDAEKRMPVDQLPPHLAEQTRVTLPHYWASHQAVMDGFAAYVVLLDDGDSDIASAAAFLLAALDDRRDEVLPILLDTFHRSPSERRRAELLLALTVIAARRPDELTSQTVAELAKSHIREGPPGNRVTLAAALCLLTLRSGDTESLLEIIRPELSASHDAFVHLPWSEANDLFSLVVDALSYEWPLQSRWILDGLRHADSAVVRSALYAAGELNMRQRTIGRSWLPVLAELLQSPDGALGSRAADLLFAIGTPGVEVLEHAARAVRSASRKRAETVLKRVRSVRDQVAHCTRFARPLLPQPVPQLLRSIAEQRASKASGYVEAVRKAVDQLSCHGSHAREAAPTLLELTKDPRFHPWVCVSALRGLWRITADAELVVPILLQHLRPEPASLALLELLREIGPPAAAALPRLRTIVEDEERFMKWGFTLDVGLLDEAFVRRATDAIHSISRS